MPSSRRKWLKRQGGTDVYASNTPLYCKPGSSSWIAQCQSPCVIYQYSRPFRRWTRQNSFGRGSRQYWQASMWQNVAELANFFQSLFLFEEAGGHPATHTHMK